MVCVWYYRLHVHIVCKVLWYIKCVGLYCVISINRFYTMYSVYDTDDVCMAVQYV